ncbi:MAG TPA: cytochrome c oxidase subunit II [Gaiellaceae bacterium]
MSPDAGTATPTPAAEAGGNDYGRRFLILWIVLSVIATPLVAIFLGPEIPPGQGSDAAGEQVESNTVLVAVLTPVLIFVLVFIGFALSHFRAGASSSDGPADRGDSRIQILWAVVTTVVVLSLATWGSYELVETGTGGGQGPTAAFLPPGHAKALDVQVIGQQWEFTYRYPTYGGLETPQLVLPADTLIRLHVTSLDVVHSFWAYQLGVKADANPGTDDIVYVQLRGPRTFQIRCAELCGLWHGYMFDTGKVVPQARFASWVKTQQNVFSAISKYLPPYALSYLPEPVHRAG